QQEAQTALDVGGQRRVGQGPSLAGLEPLSMAERVGVVERAQLLGAVLSDLQEAAVAEQDPGVVVAQLLHIRHLQQRLSRNWNRCRSRDFDDEVAGSSPESAGARPIVAGKQQRPGEDRAASADSTRFTWSKNLRFIWRQAAQLDRLAVDCHSKSAIASTCPTAVVEVHGKVGLRVAVLEQHAPGSVRVQHNLGGVAAQDADEGVCELVESGSSAVLLLLFADQSNVSAIWFDSQHPSWWRGLPSTDFELFDCEVTIGSQAEHGRALDNPTRLQAGGAQRVLRQSTSALRAQRGGRAADAADAVEALEPPQEPPADPAGCPRTGRRLSSLRCAWSARSELLLWRRWRRCWRLLRPADRLSGTAAGWRPSADAALKLLLAPVDAGAAQLDEAEAGTATRRPELMAWRPMRRRQGWGSLAIRSMASGCRLPGMSYFSRLALSMVDFGSLVSNGALPTSMHKLMPQPLVNADLADHAARHIALVDLPFVQLYNAGVLFASPLAGGLVDSTETAIAKVTTEFVVLGSQSELVAVELRLFSTVGHFNSDV
uniref:Alpha-galactosidase n=1 Tax=Macrostomum lignano TaxID=282301 RepID=A0A1I8GQY9_9PLAT